MRKINVSIDLWKKLQRANAVLEAMALYPNSLPLVQLASSEMKEAMESIQFPFDELVWDGPDVIEKFPPPPEAA